MHIAKQTFELSPFNGQARIVDAHQGVVVMEPRRDYVAIVGAGPGKEFAPYENPMWEVWSLNAIPSCDRLRRLRVDRWFEMHEMHAQSADDMEWIAKCPVPLYMVPNASSWDGTWGNHSANQVRYPLERVEADSASYFACSFAYMIALALLEGFKGIGVYGCELCYGTERERTVEWACVSWWLGLCEGRRIDVCLPPDTHLGYHRYRYGIDYDAEKRDVEQYVTLMRQSDKMRGVDLAQAYDSGKEWSQGG